MRSKLFLLLTTLLLAFTSCKKCYDCELNEICTTCTAKDSNGSTLDSGTDACGTKAEIDGFESTYKATFEQSGGTTTCTRNNTLAETREICDKPNRANSRVAVMEIAGYTCVAK